MKARFADFHIGTSFSKLKKKKKKDAFSCVWPEFPGQVSAFEGVPHPHTMVTFRGFGGNLAVQKSEMAAQGRPLAGERDAA